MSNMSAALAGDATIVRELCDTCGHPLLAHDAISVRWCAATQLGVGRRECLCSNVVRKARVLAHY